MPWSGSNPDGIFTRSDGVFTGSNIFVSQRDAGTKILATRLDTEHQDMATALSDCLNKTGINAMTGSLDMGSQRLIDLAAGSALTDGAQITQIQSNSIGFATSTGSSSAYIVALAPAVTGFTTGMKISFKANHASTGASTVNLNGLGVKTLKKKNDQDIAANDIESGAVVNAIYDGTNFQVTSQVSTTDLMSFTLTGDSGSNQTVENSETMDIAGGTGIDSVVGATNTVTLNVDSSVALVSAQNTWTKGQAGSTYTGAGLTLDFATYQNFIVTLAAGANTLANPTTEAAGQSGTMIFLQRSTGSASTISLGSDYETAAAGGLTLSSAVNDYDVVPYFVKASGSILLGTPQLNFG